VSFDTPEENAAFATKLSFSFPLLCDTTRAMGIAYGATAPGASGGAKRIGVVVGPDGTIVEVEPKVEPKTYPHDVLARL
jgi:peroxiredoxin Q/BCP